jgi:hypothetical protein
MGSDRFYSEHYDDYYPDVVVDNDVSLYYDRERNIMMDLDGHEVHNVFDIISPNTLFLFKRKKKDMLVYGRDGQAVELIWPRED